MFIYVYLFDYNIIQLYKYKYLRYVQLYVFIHISNMSNYYLNKTDTVLLY